MRRKLFFFLFLAALPFLSHAQPAEFSGIIYDAVSKLPLAFVSVTLKGTNTGTVTDIDGQFSFNNLPVNATLVISYIGYKGREYKAEKTATPVSIFMERISAELETVIVSSNENPAHRIIKLLQRNKKSLRLNTMPIPLRHWRRATVSGI